MNRIRLAMLSILPLLFWALPARGEEPVPPAKGFYAVVVSAKTAGDKDWAPVVAALKEKYDARVIPWNEGVGEVRQPLAAAGANYACFVARPEEAGRDFVVAVHRLTRRLDDDPYTDVLWGILTGYDAADALRVARLREPLVLKKVLAGTSGAWMGPFEEGAMFDEGKAGSMRVKTRDGKIEDQGCPNDSTKAIVDYFNQQKPDGFITSGHATEHDWQIGYSYRNGQLRHQDGQLFGLDTARQRYDIHSPNPKVYLPVGNCLIGNIAGRDCMVTSLIHSAGVVQMFGYTVPTWYGKGGWGIQEVYLGQPGRWTLAQAFFINTQAMLHEIETRYPKSARVDFDQYDMERNPALLGQLAARHHLTDRDEKGLLWDRDTVAFYGDPAWEARPLRGPPAWEQKLVMEGNRYVLTLTANEDGAWPGKPVMELLPHRIAGAKIVKGEDTKAVITENFILVPLQGKFRKGDKVEIVFEAGRAARGTAIAA